MDLAVCAATLGDLFAEARLRLDEDEFRDLLTIAAHAIATQVADRIEDDWMAS
jgi:hypothetical protein